MTRVTVPIMLILLCLPLAGCFQHTFTIGTGAPDGEQVYKAWHHHWLFGLIRPEFQHNVLVSELCPSGNATIHKEKTFLNGLIDILTWFIYSPTTVTITFGDGSEVSVDLDAEEVAEIVTDPLFLEIVAETMPERLADVRAAAEGRSAAPESAVAMASAP